MSYITSSLSPYRDKDLSKEFFQILEEDHEWVCSSLEGRGLLFVIAYIVLMSMALLKAIVFLFEQMGKPVMTYSHLDLKRNMHEESITSILTRRESIEEVQNHDNFCPNDNVKTQRAEKIISLRNYLYQHNLTLHAQVLKVTQHKVSEEDLFEMYRTGEITKPLSTSKVTFGQEVNSLLSEVLGKDIIDLKIDKITKETYIKVLNEEFIPIKDALSNLYNENIRIVFD